MKPDDSESENAFVNKEGANLVCEKINDGCVIKNSFVLELNDDDDHHHRIYHRDEFRKV